MLCVPLCKPPFISLEKADAIGSLESFGLIDDVINVPVFLAILFYFFNL